MGPPKKIWWCKWASKTLVANSIQFESGCIWSYPNAWIEKDFERNAPILVSLLMEESCSKKKSWSVVKSWGSNNFKCWISIDSCPLGILFLWQKNTFLFNIYIYTEHQSAFSNSSIVIYCTPSPKAKILTIFLPWQCNIFVGFPHFASANISNHTAIWKRHDSPNNLNQTSWGNSNNTLLLHILGEAFFYISCFAGNRTFQLLPRMHVNAIQIRIKGGCLKRISLNIVLCYTPKRSNNFPRIWESLILRLPKLGTKFWQNISKS